MERHSEPDCAHFLTIRVEGPSVGPARMRLADFLLLADETMRAVRRVGAHLHQGEDEGQPAAAFESLSLDLVGFTHGSDAAVACFERSVGQTVIPEADPGLQAYRAWLEGLPEVSGGREDLPMGYDLGVLLKMRDLGKLFARGIDRIAFCLRGPQAPIAYTYTPQAAQRIHERVSAPETRQVTISGRLVMADFRATRPKFRVDRPVGGSVLCEFPRELEEEVLGNVLRYVTVQGEATYDPVSGKLKRLRVTDLQRDTLDDFEFWHPRSIEELAEEQGVKPITDPTVLLGGWPDDVDDGFDEFLAEMRRSDVFGGDGGSEEASG